MFKTNGCLQDSDNKGKIIKLQGDQRENVSQFLAQFDICKKEEIIVHGF